MISRDKINKIRLLAEQGATEGERNAAREALRRIEATAGATLTPPQREGRPAPAPGVTGMGHVSEEELLRVFREVGLQGKTTADIINDLMAHFFEEAMGTAQKSTAKHHHGRVTFDSN